MKLILHRLPDNQHYMPIFYKELFKMWLLSNGLHPDENFRLSYNSFYHFYDLSLFETKDGRNNYIKSIIDFLIKEGYKISHSSKTWRWYYTYDNNDKRIAHQINGVRIFIDVSDLAC